MHIHISFQGVFSDGEEEMDDMLLSPEHQLHKALDHMVSLVFKSQERTEICSGYCFMLMKTNFGFVLAGKFKLVLLALLLLPRA